MTVNYDSFIAKFPEFESLDSDIVSLLIDNTLIELDLEYIESPQKEQAYYLAIAHYLFLSNNEDPLLSGNIKIMETKNNKVEFAVGSVDAGSWLLSSYGQRLQRILDQNINIGFGVRG